MLKKTPSVKHNLYLAVIRSEFILSLNQVTPLPKNNRSRSFASPSGCAELMYKP
jgi:hypothetical protein